MEKSIEKSEEQAEIIKAIALPVLMLDVDYCRQAAKDMQGQASKQESMAVLNPSHSQKKNDILRMKGTALLKLCEYVEALKEIQKLNGDLLTEEINQEHISKMFI